MSEPANNPLLPAAYELFWSAAVIAALLLIVIALIGIARTAPRLTPRQAQLWTLTAILIPVLGPSAWLFIGRRSVDGVRET